MASEQAVQFANFFAALRARTSNPDLDLPTIRDVVETMHPSDGCRRENAERAGPKSPRHGARRTHFARTGPAGEPDNRTLGLNAGCLPGCRNRHTPRRWRRCATSTTPRTSTERRSPSRHSSSTTLRSTRRSWPRSSTIWMCYPSSTVPGRALGASAHHERVRINLRHRALTN